MIATMIASAEYTAMLQAVLGAVLGVVAVLFFVTLGMLLARNKAEKTRLDHDVYKRELVSNKEIREQKREKKKEQTGEKKPRHGKKNKNKAEQ